MLATYIPTLFSIYIVLAVGYNLVSLLLVEVTGKRAAPTDPVVGIMMMSILYLTYATGPQVSRLLYLFLLPHHDWGNAGRTGFQTLVYAPHYLRVYQRFGEQLVHSIP